MSDSVKNELTEINDTLKLIHTQLPTTATGVKSNLTNSTRLLGGVLKDLEESINKTTEQNSKSANALVCWTKIMAVATGLLAAITLISLFK